MPVIILRGCIRRHLVFPVGVECKLNACMLNRLLLQIEFNVEHMAGFQHSNNLEEPVDFSALLAECYLTYAPCLGISLVGLLLLATGTWIG